MRRDCGGFVCPRVAEVMPVELRLDLCPVRARGVGAGVVSPVDDEHAARQFAFSIRSEQWLQRRAKAERGSKKRSGRFMGLRRW